MTTPTPPPAKRVLLRVRLPFSSEEEFIEKYGQNLTRGGIFIATKTPKAEGTLVSFDLILTDGTKLMRGEGFVQSVTAHEQPGRSGMLVRFERVDARTKALVDRVIVHRSGVMKAEPPVMSPSSALPESPAPAPVSAAPLKKGARRLSDDVVMGIDLGTTTCRVALFLEGAPRLVTIPSERSLTMPSVIAWDPSRRELLVGSAAKQHRIDHPENAVSGFKRLMGRRARSKKIKELRSRFAFTLEADPEGDAGAMLGGRVYSMAELAAELLQVLKGAAQESIGQELSRCVMCVPAWYNDHQRTAVLTAAQLAGLEPLRVLNEPSAVALAFGYGRGLARKRVLVYDLGGGTFDAAVVEITGDDLEVVSTGGDNFLGGLDFDERLADALIATLPLGPKERVLASRMTVERVRSTAEVAKIALSDRTEAPVHVPFATTDDEGQPMALRVDVERSFLEHATQDLVERTAVVTQAVLETAKLTPQHLDEVLMVGGQSRAPAVRQRLTTLLGREARSDVDPQGAVALGAALLGHSMVMRERGKRGVSLSEVLSAPIGVAVKGGAMRRVLERNTRLPAEKTLQVPVQANQALSIAVFQGSNQRADENDYLGAIAAVSDRPGDLSLRFAVTADGRLTLSATTPTGKNVEITFATREASDEVQAMLLAEAPLPGEEDAKAKGLLTGLKKFFGR